MENLVELLQIHPGVQRCHLIAVAVEHERLAPAQVADAPLVCLTPSRMADLGVHVGIEAVLAGAALFQDVLGSSEVSRMRTMDLPLLKPYFQGTTTRSGAPF